jgi:uncharacterized protein YuzB (UPF0349 family)
MNAKIEFSLIQLKYGGRIALENLEHKSVVNVPESLKCMTSIMKFMDPEMNWID